MAFETLLGNRQIKENLTESLLKGHISHFYLISGPEGAGKRTLARLLAAAILCRESQKPCLGCHSCRKVMAGTHPDFITVDDPEKKTVTVDLIRQARSDMYIQPNESDYKIYLFPRAQDMGLPGQNALLKVLEEPPAYGVFLLLTDNPEKLLPTVRSRCVQLRMQAVPREQMLPWLRSRFPNAQQEDLDAACRRSRGFLGQAEAMLAAGAEPSEQSLLFVRAYSRKDPLELMKLLVPMEKWKRDALTEAVEGWLELLESALVSRSGQPVVSAQARVLAQERTGGELYQGVVCMKTALEYLQSNVSPAAVCGYLEWALR